MPDNRETEPPGNLTLSMRKSFKRPGVDAWFPGTFAEVNAPVSRVGVIGAGVMGSGIAQWLSARGFGVVLLDVDEQALNRASEIIAKHFEEVVRRGRTGAAEAENASNAIRMTTDWEGIAKCDLIIEAIVEDIAAKQSLFAKLASLVPPTTILASNTSALPIDEIGAGVSGSERMIGIHFFNPVGRMPLVEVSLGSLTSRPTADRVAAWTRAIGKRAVFCRSSPGFIVTRMLFFYLNDAMRIWITQPDTRAIDEAMLDFGMPMGPLRLIDEIGIDVTACVINSMRSYYAGRFEPATTAATLVGASLNGRKGGAGFYHYSSGGEVVNEEAAVIAGAAPSGDPLTAEQIRDRLLALMVREARGCMEEGVVKSPEDIDFAMRLGTGFPASRGGLTQWAAAQARTRTVSAP
jgi:3-hydroxyacyl-CoA dehydrogenase / enoyl-CoA hydratase / 3-hydroxybutyryl-CoA epimerase